MSAKFFMGENKNWQFQLQNYTVKNVKCKILFAKKKTVKLLSLTQRENSSFSRTSETLRIGKFISSCEYFFTDKSWKMVSSLAGGGWSAAYAMR